MIDFFTVLQQDNYMPESTADVLPTTVLLKNLSPQVEQTITAMESNTSTIRDRRKYEEKFGSEIKKRFNDVDENVTESVLDLLFGGDRIDDEALKGGTESEDQKQLSARIQHNQVSNILDSALESADPAYAETIYRVVSYFEKIAQSSDGDLDGLRGFWNGVKSEHAVASALLSGGYKVFLPNHMQDQYEVDDEDNEVLQWDVRNGVDLVAVKGDTVYLIDAKGRMRTDDRDERHTVEVQSRDLGKLPDNLSRFIRQFGEGNISRKKIIIPTSSLYLSGLLTPKGALRYSDPSVDTSSPAGLEKIALDNFARLPGYMENELLHDLELD
jgi:hypothetical protein